MLITFNRNTEFNAGFVIPTSSNFHMKALLERRWWKANQGRKNIEINACRICVSYYVPTCNVDVTPSTDRYLYCFSCEIIRWNWLDLDWVQGKSFWLEVSYKRLHLMYMVLNKFIGFSKSEHLYEHKLNTLNMESSTK